MEKSEIEELKKKFELKKQAEKLTIEIPINSEKALETIINDLYEQYKKGENVYVERYVNIPTGYTIYKIYSCDFEGRTPEQLLNKVINNDNKIETAEKVVIKNGSYKLPETMLKTFDEGSDTIFVFNGNNGISAIFDHYDLDVRTDEDFLDYATLLMTGKTREEIRQKEEKIAEDMRIEKEQRIEEIKEQIPHWIEQGNSMIYAEKQEDWKNYIASFQGDNMMYAVIVEQALEVMKSLNENGSLIEAEQILNKQGHSGTSLDEVMNIVFEFSKKGPDFYEDATRYVLNQEIGKEKARKISDKRTENKEYAFAEKNRVQNELTKEENGKIEISTEKVGKVTINVPTELKNAVEQIEQKEKEDNIIKGE